MHFKDFITLSFSAIRAKRMRSGLTTLGVAIGIAAVVLLTSIGEGLQRYILAEFSQFGTNIIGIHPGKISTAGFAGAMISSVRPLTLEDAQALTRIPQIIAAVPVIQGNALIEGNERQRRTASLKLRSASFCLMMTRAARVRLQCSVVKSVRNYLVSRPRSVRSFGWAAIAFE